MSDKIVPFPRPSTKPGNLSFMECPCSPGVVSITPVVIAGERPIISSLLCTECEAEWNVLNGVVLAPGVSDE